VHRLGPGFFSGTSFASLADQYGFIVIYPSVTRSGSCWDVSSSQALTRNGGSDPVGLMSMITYTEQHYGGNPNQVYVTGASSGAMMTNVMLADYPDVFKAGAGFMGVPYYCFFTGTVDGWNSACADGQVSMTAQAWGSLVRNTADPGYNGPRPRVQLWHGTADGTLNCNNFGQEILQWTNVLGVSSTPTSTTTPLSGWTEAQYDNGSGTVEVEGFSIAGAGHVLPIEGEGMEADAIAFFGLNTTTQGNTVTVTSPGNQTSTAGRRHRLTRLPSSLARRESWQRAHCFTKAMDKCITCGKALHPERAKKYDYCMSRECQEKNAKGLTMVAVGVNKAAEQYMILDERTREELASGKYHDQRRGSFGTSLASGAAASSAPARTRTPEPPAARQLQPQRQRTVPKVVRRPWTRSQEKLALLYNEQGLRPDEIAGKLGLSTYNVTQIILNRSSRGKL
jgi:poly(hydroxyalkanoate) depolymerase family esterase